MKSYTSFILALIFLLMSNVSHAAKISGCCEKHNFKNKAPYVFKYDDNQKINIDSELKNIKKLMLKDDNIHIKVLALINAADEKVSIEKFKESLSNIVTIKKYLISAGIDKNRVLLQVKVFINNKKIKDSIRIYKIIDKY